MKNARPGDLLESTFLANPQYELVCFDRLPSDQRDLLRDLCKDPGFYGVLRPLGKTGLGVKSVSRDTALLYLTLQQPGPLPEYVRTTLGDQCHREITRLVLDGVLALDWEGEFLSGPEAAARIYRSEGVPAEPAVQGFLERLSLDALRYAQSLRLTDPIALAARLYAYNRTPLSPFWKRTLPDTTAVTEYLGIRDGKNRTRLDRDWLAVPDDASAGWLAWRARSFGAGAAQGNRTSVACKLYISPRINSLPEVFGTILAVLGRTRTPHFKVGRDASGLLRPDKLVAYFRRDDDLRQTAEALATELRGCPVQGVPFSAEVAGDGLLSMGIDPPEGDQTLPWVGRESWRLWVANRLAVALIAAAADKAAGQEPWQFAVRRLQLEGVDTRSWIPA